MSFNPEIEHQYMPSRWSKRHSPQTIENKHIQIVTTVSDDTKFKIPYEKNIRYGNREGQLMDIFGKDFLKPDAKIFVYIHGGYWQSLNKDISSYCVEPLFESGIRTVIPGYDLAPCVKLDTIVTEIKELAIYILNLAYKCNSHGVWFGGHSAGAHLVAQLLNDDFLLTINENHKKLFKGLILISGIFDLEPIVQTSVNELLNLTKSEIEKYSSVINFHKPTGNAEIKVLIAVAENDSPEFQRQSEDFAKVLEKIKIQTTFMKINNEDHFSIVEKLRDANYELTKEIVKFIKS